MTLLGALMSESEIFVASDSQLVKTDARRSGEEIRRVIRMYRLPGRNIVWGYVGEEPIGEELRRTLELAAPTDWSDFDGHVSLFLAAANRAPGPGERRSDLTVVLAAGWFDHERRIVSFDELGHPTQAADSSFIGWGKVEARSALRAVNMAKPDTKGYTKLKIAMEATIEECEGLEGPVQMWKVRATSVELLR